MDFECVNEIFNFIVSIFQIAFWIGAFTLAVLTYEQAKKTIFSGARGDVFKIQISEIKKLLDFLNDRNNFNYDDENNKIQKISLISIFGFFLHNFEMDSESKEKIKEQIELNTGDPKEYCWISPAGPIGAYTINGKVVLNKQYTIYKVKFDTALSLREFINNIFIPDNIKSKINDFLNYERSKEDFLTRYFDEKVFVHERIEKDPYNYAIETYHEFYKKYMDSFSPALDRVDLITSEIKNYLKVNDLIG
jgi:hypothetical protein